MSKWLRRSWGLVANRDRPQEEKCLLPVQHRSPQAGSCSDQTLKTFQVSTTRSFALRPLPSPHAQWKESQAGLIVRIKQDWQLRTKLGLPADQCLSAVTLGASQSHDWESAAVWKTKSDFLVLFPGWRVRFPSRPWEVLRILLIWKPLHWVAGLVWPIPLVLAFLSPKKKSEKWNQSKPQTG